MNYRSTLFALATGFGILIALIAALAIGAIRKADAMYGEMQVAQDSYLRAEAFRRGIATDTYLADILLRDYLARSVTGERPTSPGRTACGSQIPSKPHGGIVGIAARKRQPGIDQA